MPKPASSIHSIAPDTKHFFFPKGRVRVILIAIIGLQKRDDLSGKFAKKLGRMRRAFTEVDEALVAEQNETLERFTKKGDDDKPLPFYATTEDGNPIFKKDDKGNDTEERIPIPNRFQLTDAKAYQQELKEMARELVTVECSSFLALEGVPELDLFKAVNGEIIDALQDLEEGSESTLSVEDRVAALRAQMARSERAIAELGAPLASRPELVTESPVADESSDEGRSAP